MSQKNLMVGVACGLVVGAVAGATAALLLAPASGAEARRRLRYEREHAVELAQRKARRAMARWQPELPVEEEEEEDAEEEVVAFIGA